MGGANRGGNGGNRLQQWNDNQSDGFQNKRRRF